MNKGKCELKCCELREKVRKMEEEERLRRIGDTLGEQQRRLIAHQVSEIVTTSLRPGWFQKGSTYVFSLFNMAREAGNNLLRSSQVRAMASKLQVAGQKGYATAQDVKHKVEAAGHKAQETSDEMKHNMQQKLGIAQDVAHHGIEKVEEVVHKLKNVSLKLIGTVNKVWTNFTVNTSLAYAVLEEENERAYRLKSDEECFAIFNALRVSNLIKELAPELYRPLCEPTRRYSTKLLEEIERSRRIQETLYDHVAINNALAISLLIEQKFRSISSEVIATTKQAKKEVVEEIKSTVPLTAAM